MLGSDYPIIVDKIFDENTLYSNGNEEKTCLLKVINFRRGGSFIMALWTNGPSG